jgi:hypothetical protein
VFGLGKRKSQETELDVRRTRKGISSTPKAQRELQAMLRADQHQRNMNDRVGKRLRWGRETDGWWYLVKGSRWWMRQEDKPGWHNGFYYIPGRWYPVVPPREFWGSRTSYNGQPGRTGMTSVVPDDILKAAYTTPRDLVGKRDSSDPSIKTEQFRRTRERAGEGDTRLGLRASKTRPARKVAPRKGSK